MHDVEDDDNLLFRDRFDPEREGVCEHDADLLDEHNDDDSFECPECGRLVWGDADVCNGCGRAFTAKDRYGPAPVYTRFGRWYNRALLALVIVVLIIALVVSIT